MSECIEFLRKKKEENQRAVRELESRLKLVRERLLLYGRLYELETQKAAAKGATAQLDMPVVRKPFEKAGRLSIAEATMQMLRESSGPLHGKEIFKRLHAYGASAKNLNTVAGTLSNRPKLFKNVGNNTWVLRKGASLN